MSGHVIPPIRGVKVRSSRDHDSAQALVGSEAQVSMVHDGSRLRTAVSIATMARCAKRTVNRLSACGVACGPCCIGGGGIATQSIGLTPALANPADNRIHLLVRQHAAFFLRKRRHCRTGTPRGDDVTQYVVINEPEIYRIRQHHGRPILSVSTVASLTVLIEERNRVEHRVRPRNFRPWTRLARQMRAPG